MWSLERWCSPARVGAKWTLSSLHRMNDALLYGCMSNAVDGMHSVMIMLCDGVCCLRMLIILRSFECVVKVCL